MDYISASSANHKNYVVPYDSSNNLSIVGGRDIHAFSFNEQGELDSAGAAATKEFTLYSEFIVGPNNNQVIHSIVQNMQQHHHHIKSPDDQH